VDPDEQQDHRGDDLHGGEGTHGTSLDRPSTVSRRYPKEQPPSSPNRFPLGPPEWALRLYVLHGHELGLFAEPAIGDNPIPG
jgi:hypothetical protein